MQDIVINKPTMTFGVGSIGPVNLDMGLPVVVDFSQHECCRHGANAYWYEDGSSQKNEPAIYINFFQLLGMESLHSSSSTFTLVISICSLDFLESTYVV